MASHSYIREAFLFLGLYFSLTAAQPLVVISVDGLDNRYLADADALHLKIPNLRRLMGEGEVSTGVVGVVPTITWPSHTTLITGVDPVIHGILSNRRPKSEGGGYPWSASLIKAPTLLTGAHKAGKTIATITWPVTVDAPVDWNLPEYFERRRGGFMDMRSIESKSKPSNLVAEISAAYPSFPQEWMDDRTRTLAAVFLLKNKHPDLLLMHLVDLDSEEHDDAPFSREANAVLERTDELIGQVMAAMPKNGAIAIVSDHGFERVNQLLDVRGLAAKEGVTNLMETGGILVAPDERAAAFVRNLAASPKYGIGREIPKQERLRFRSNLPEEAAAFFEPAEGFMFWPSPKAELFTKPQEIGNHGFWPTRYRSVFVLAGEGIPRRKLPEFSLKEIATRLARVLGIAFTPATN